MKTAEGVISVKYQTKKQYCSCCDKELDEPEISGTREFFIAPQDIKDYGDWSVLEEEELEDEIPEFIYGMINFYAVDGEKQILFLDGELEKASDYIKTYLSNSQ